jgi:hypothetical protein
MKSIFKKGAILSLLFNFLFLCLKCQTTFNTRIDFYNKINLSASVLVEQDTFFVASNTWDSILFNINKVSVIKLSNTGSVLSKKSFVRDSMTFPIFNNMIRFNNVFYIPGSVQDNDGNISGAIYQFNNNLDTIRNVIQGDSSFSTYYCSLINKQNYLYIFGVSDSTCGTATPGNKYFIKKTDTLGNIVWQKEYATTCTYRNPRNIDTTKDDGFVICGFERTSPSGVGTTRVVKTDSLGNQVWTQNYGIINTSAPSIISTKTSGYLIATNQIDSTYLTSFYWMTLRLYRIDENGDTLWTKKIGNKNMAFSPTTIKQLANYDYIVSGSNGVPHYDITGSVVSDQLQGFLCRIDSSGNVKWFNNYTGNYLNDSSAQNYLYDVAPTNDGGFVAVGFVAPTDGSTQDSWVIKVDSMGCLSPGCNGTVGVTTIHIGEPEFNIYPNPANDFIEIETDFENSSISVFDVTGKLILREKIIQNKTRIDLSNYSTGLYFIQLQSEQKMLSKKFIKH